MPYRPTKHEREAKLKRRLEVMPEVYEKVGIPTIGEKSEKIMEPTDMLEKIYPILNSEGIVGQDRIKYLNFARIVFRLKQRYTGKALTDQVEREFRAYIERVPGVNPEVLKKVKDEVLGVQTTSTTTKTGAPQGT
jgi:DNA-directed RNA polymerase subunit F